MPALPARGRGRWLPPAERAHTCRLPMLWPWTRTGARWQCHCGRTWRLDRDLFRWWWVLDIPARGE